MKISRYQKLFGVGPLGVSYSLALLGILWLLDRALLHHVKILDRPWLLRLAGIVLIAAWLCWHFWCFRTIRSWWNDGQLCTRGPYRFVRHPIYAGGIFGSGIGISLLFNSWILLLWPVLAYPVWSMLVRREEKMMASVFGDAYERYAAGTGRLFPRLFK